MSTLGERTLNPPSTLEKDLETTHSKLGEPRPDGAQIWRFLVPFCSVGPDTSSPNPDRRRASRRSGCPTYLFRISTRDRLHSAQPRTNTRTVKPAAAVRLPVDELRPLAEPKGHKQGSTVLRGGDKYRPWKTWSDSVLHLTSFLCVLLCPPGRL